MNLFTEKLELRGISNATSGKGNVYYIVHCEEEDGNAVQFYCKNSNAFAQGLKKGDAIKITLKFNPKFKSLEVSAVSKVGA